MGKNDDENPKPKPVKRPAKPKAKWLVPRGIAWLEDGETIRLRAGAKVADGVIPDELVADYAGRGDIVNINTAERG